MIGGLGVQELLIVLIIALVLFGGKKLPEVGANLGKALRGFKDSSEEAMEEMRRENNARAPEPKPYSTEYAKKMEEAKEPPAEDAKPEEVPGEEPSRKTENTS